MIIIIHLKIPIVHDPFNDLVDQLVLAFLRTHSQTTKYKTRLMWLIRLIDLVNDKKTLFFPLTFDYIEKVIVIDQIIIDSYSNKKAFRTQN